MKKPKVGAAALAAAMSVAGAAYAQRMAMLPGQWEIVSTTTAVEMPNAPPAAANMMRGRTMTIKHCITPQQIAEGPQAAMKNNKSCTINYHAGAAGRFTSEMVCKQDSGGTATATSSGVMGPTSFSSSSKMAFTGAQPMTVSSTATGRRVGDCKG